MAIFKALEFDGVNSLDYGIYITGEAVYNAPERAVEMINIPGKNGALALDQGRFENIEVTYHAGCFADSQADFADKVMRFRNALASRYTYKRLTDEYHPDEYRLGLYKSGLDVDTVRYGTAGEFNIVFDCKPQRFLVDGDRAISPTEWSDLQTESGELVTIDSDGSLAVKALEVELEPIQSLNGYSHPWVGGAGKNLFWVQEGSDWSGISCTLNSKGTYVLNGTTASGTPAFIRSTAVTLKAGTYRLWGKADNNPQNRLLARIRNATTMALMTTIIPDNGTGANVSIAEDTSVLFEITVYDSTTLTNTVVYPQLEVGTTKTEWEPYSNICPISGHDEVNVYVSPTTSESDATVYTTDLSGTRYGGTLDVVSGVLTVTKAIVDLGSLTWTYNTSASTPSFRATLSGLKYVTNAEHIFDAICSIYATTSYDNAISRGVDSTISNRWNQETVVVVDSRYTDATTFKTAMNGVQLCYELATPQTYQLTPQQIDLLLGTNHLWSDGEITVEYGVHPYYNPTPFDAKPLIKVTGTGTLGIGEYILTITGTASQTLYIDCETMEIYTLEGTVPTGASSLVSINRNDFPVLEPGTNYISVGSGITAVTITPRWWRI